MSKRKRVREELSFKTMSTYFDQPVEEAGRKLGRTPLEIRTCCRELGFSWPRGDIERFKKQIKSSKTLLEKTDQTSTDPAVIATLTQQIEAAEVKIQMLYKDPSECNSQELETRNNISRPYKRRNHNVGVLTENEKERYRMLFTPMAAQAQSSSSSAASMTAFVAFFDRLDSGGKDGDSTTNSRNSKAVRVTPLSVAAAESICSTSLQKPAACNVATSGAGGDAKARTSPVPTFSLGSYFDDEKEPMPQMQFSASGTVIASHTLYSSTGTLASSVSDSEDDEDFAMATAFISRG